MTTWISIPRSSERDEHFESRSEGFRIKSQIRRHKMSDDLPSPEKWRRRRRREGTDPGPKPAEPQFEKEAEAKRRQPKFRNYFQGPYRWAPQ